MATERAGRATCRPLTRRCRCGCRGPPSLTAAAATTTARETFRHKHTFPTWQPPYLGITHPWPCQRDTLGRVHAVKTSWPDNKVLIRVASVTKTVWPRIFPWRGGPSSRGGPSPAIARRPGHSAGPGTEKLWFRGAPRPADL